ncbi:hypothetical protein PtA15_8A183 [Puccinia triticina]|uniref:Uncharacterized protein n=1 Tax=Puccinia triticina TaxID=208348 RepID=A0ABY7CRJ1_9BASI|nr:uncharacterized protein PtA15_8A183 [Puccinia triticina]WAQ87279.1 hypothetical protein PtA15_8A183 [Puccinia triticina]WAR57130.1 hypothetical protein PtB15_8B176 [Puccinia triticina]
MPSSRSLGAALLLGVMPLIQDSYSAPVGGLWESSRDFAPGMSSSAHHGRSDTPTTQRMKKSHLVQPRSSTAETISQHVDRILGTPPPSDMAPVDVHPEPKEKSDGPATGAGDHEKAPPPTADHNPQEKHAPDSDASKASPPNQAHGPNPPAQKENGSGHGPNKEIPNPDDDPSAADVKAQVDKTPQPDSKAQPHGDDHSGGVPPAQKEGGPEAPAGRPEEHPPPPPAAADPHKPDGHPEATPAGPPHPIKDDEHPPPGAHGPEKVKTQTTEIAVIAGIRIERVDSIFPPTTPAHPPAPAGPKPEHDPKEHPLEKDHPPPPPAASGHDEPKDHPAPPPAHDGPKDHPAPPPAANGHDEPKDHPAEKDHPTPPGAANAHVEPKDHPPAPEGHEHLADKDHPAPKQIELPGGITIMNDSKPGNPADAGPRAIRITTDKIKIELSL